MRLLFLLFSLMLLVPGAAAQVPMPPEAAPMIGTQYFPVLAQNALPDAEPKLVPVVTNRPLSDPQDGVTHAVVFIHDLTRNPNDGVAMLTTLAGADNNASLMIAPQFLIEADRQRFRRFLPDAGENFALWASNDWRDGQDSVAKAPDKGISSFAVVDLLLLYLADRKLFPELKHVTLAGHGMGADFVLRYAAMGRAVSVLEADDISVRFLAANPSSYLFLTRDRPPKGKDAKGAPIMPDLSQCPGFQNYPYGLANLNPYGRSVGVNDIRQNYPLRRIVYLLGDDVEPDSFLDQGCAAMLQGADRLSRGQNFAASLKRNFGDVTRQTQQFVTIPRAGYDPVALFGSYCGMALLFGDGVCQATRQENPE